MRLMWALFKFSTTHFINANILRQLIAITIIPIIKNYLNIWGKKVIKSKSVKKMIEAMEAIEARLARSGLKRKRKKVPTASQLYLDSSFIVHVP